MVVIVNLVGLLHAVVAAAAVSITRQVLMVVQPVVVPQTDTAMRKVRLSLRHHCKASMVVQKTLADLAAVAAVELVGLVYLAVLTSVATAGKVARVTSSGTVAVAHCLNLPCSVAVVAVVAIAIPQVLVVATAAAMEANVEINYQRKESTEQVAAVALQAEVLQVASVSGAVQA
jgi:hypothetical protein